MEENDLPLLSNIESVRARHYLLKLTPDVTKQIIYGNVIIFFDLPSDCEIKGDSCNGKCSCNLVNSTSKREATTFPITLECNNLTIKNISDIKPKTDQNIEEYIMSDVKKDANDFDLWIHNDKSKLSFTQDKWSIKIQNQELFHSNEFPKAIFIEYSISSEGESLYWRKSGNGSACFFTSGSYLNNRSLVPSQDRPLAMATWQAWIIVPEGFLVSMTGDEDPVVSDCASQLDSLIIKENLNCFYYYTSMVLPMATIAIAVGKWKRDVLLSIEDADNYNKSYYHNSSLIQENLCDHMTYPCHMSRKSHIEPLIPVTVVTSDTDLSSGDKLPLMFVKYILISSFKLLGIHPFKRLEIVIMPRCFPHIGLASPNLLFISKSVVIDDSSFYLRLSHEISHSWFGITIGPKNWEEEWLSEGVATYLEDSIFVLALELSMKDEFHDALGFADIVEKYSDFFLLRGHLRYKMLLSEMENSEDKHQILCPDGLAPSVGEGTITNGLCVDKSFMQVHYLKGYFLLYYLGQMVTRQAFDAFLGFVAVKCHGRLISSIEFLKLFYSHFSLLSEIDNPETYIFNSWLKNSDINSEIVDTFCTLKDNKLISNVNEHYSYWMNINDIKNCQTLSYQSLEKKNLLSNKKFDYSDQIVLLFELLLQVKSMKKQTLNSIHSFYKIKSRNAEIQHRWCELIIKFKYPNLDDISNFLIDNQSMGVYIYGELMISGNKKHAKVAKDTFLFLKPELSTNSKSIISSMVFGE